ncbi:hypothetical protein [Nonomuraea sp. NPDC002799]
MRWTVIVAGAAAAGVLVAGFLLFENDEEQRPARERLVSQPLPESVLTDSQGAVMEEFSGDCADSRYPYVCARVRDELGAELRDRRGLTIRTTIDLRLQRAAEQAIADRVGSGDRPVAAQAMIVPGTGEIRALAVNHASSEGYASHQGSTAMVYALTAALEKGLRFEDGFPYSAQYRPPRYTSFKNCAGEAVGDPAHAVTNVGREHGRFTTLRSGTWAAENTFFLRLTEQVGLCESVRAAERLGLQRADGSPIRQFETFVLGINDVDPISVATTYATLAGRGRRCAPMAATEVRQASRVLRSTAPRCTEALEPAVADAVTDMLAKGLAGSPLKGLGRDAAGLQGTTVDDETAWYAGYTPGLAAAVALAVPGHTSTDRLTDVTIGGRHYPHVTGLSIPGPIWKASMKAALDGVPEAAFVAPDAGRFGGCADNCAK